MFFGVLPEDPIHSPENTIIHVCICKVRQQWKVTSIENDNFEQVTDLAELVSYHWCLHGHKSCICNRVVLLKP